MNKNYRHEQKYLIRKCDVPLLRQYLESSLVIDKYSKENSTGYFIRSLYFDDSNLTAYHEKENGVYIRHKYRIRIYNNDYSRIVLERKSKEGELVYKYQQDITKEDVFNIINHDYIKLNAEPGTLMEEFLVKSKINKLNPVVIVDYNRIAYTSEYGNVRITIDYDISCVNYENNFFDTNPIKHNILDDENVLLEVKYNYYLSPTIISILEQFPLVYKSFSKYNSCIDKKVEVYGNI